MVPQNLRGHLLICRGSSEEMIVHLAQHKHAPSDRTHPDLRSRRICVPDESLAGSNAIVEECPGQPLVHRLYKR